MDNFTQNSNLNNPVPTNTEVPVQNKKPSSIGGLIGIIIIILFILLGGMYFWGQRVEQQTQEEIILDQDTQTEDLQNQSDSDELAAIEADLDATSLEGLDSELEALDTELKDSGF